MHCPVFNSTKAAFHETAPTAATIMNFTQLSCIAASAALYFSFYHLNGYAFHALELHAGASWIFLPAGVRLLCTLLFGFEGALGLWLASLAIVHFSFGHFDIITALGSTLLSAGAPYLVYRLALRAGLPDTLAKLTPLRLAQLGVAYAFANGALHSVWYALRGVHPDLLSGFVTMFIGDLAGTLIVLYAMKMLLAVLRPQQSARHTAASNSPSDAAD